MKLKFGFVLFFLFVLIISLSAQNILRVPVDYTTLQEAVDEAAPGDIIKIEPGDFYGYTIISKPLTLEGSGKDQTILYYNDETSSVGLDPGIMNFAKISKPVIRIETTGKVIIKDLEIRGAQEGFLHFGTTPFGLISNNSDLELRNLSLRRLGNIAVWVNRGSLLAVDVNFADNMGYKYQADLGFHLTNLSHAEFLRFNQTQDSIDHSININDFPEGDREERRTVVKIEDSTIVASALFWGDCVRSYGGADITIINTDFYRNSGGEKPRNLGNTGISFNGGRSTLRVSGSSFKNMVEGIRLMTLPRNDQFYEVIIENTLFDTFSGAPILVTGQGKAEIDLGGGQLGSVGNNVLIPREAEFVIVEESKQVDIFYQNDTGSEEKKLVVIDAGMQILQNGSVLYETNLQGLKLLKAVLANSLVVASYQNDKQQFLGIFTTELEFISEFNMGTLDIINFKANESTILCHYKTIDGLHYIGTFSTLLSFLGDYWFYSNVEILDSYFEDGEIRVLYGYENGESYTGYFSNEMEYIKSVSRD